MAGTSDREQGGDTVQKGKMLIVDDQLGIRMLLSEVFQDEAFETFTAENGTEAIEHAYRNKPDIVLLDMKLPGMNGLEIYREFKHIIPEAKVVIMTAYGEMNLVEEAINMGASHYFLKPFDIFDVRDKVKELIDGTTSYRN